MKPLKPVSILSALLITFCAFGAIDFDQFKLKPIQRDLLVRMQEKDKYTEETLLKMAKAFERANANESNRREYIPPHDAELLADVNHWAKGGAFSSYASYANIKFLADPYKEDCPSWAIFNFGRATGVEFLRYDILRGAINISSELQMHYSRHVNDIEKYREAYLKVAEREGFMQYLDLSGI